MKTDTTDFEGEDFMHLKFPILQDGSKYAVFFNATETIIDEMTLDEKKANTKLLGVFGMFMFAMPWLLQKLMTFTSTLLGNLSSYSY